MGVAGDLCVPRRRRCPCIASSSLLDFLSQAPLANVTVLMEPDTEFFQGSSSVGDLVFFFNRHLGEGFSKRRVVEDRVVTEPVSASGFLSQLSLNFARHFNQVLRQKETDGRYKTRTS